jgi:hypothetical protein
MRNVLELRSTGYARDGPKGLEDYEARPAK